MLQPITNLPRGQQPMPISARTRTWAWILAGANSLTVVWMLSGGAWLDDHSGLLAMATWGGHHRLVLLVSATALVAFAVCAVLTDGFTRGTRTQLGVTVTAMVVSVLAMAGVLAVAVPFVVAATVLGLLVRLWR